MEFHYGSSKYYADLELERRISRIDRKSGRLVLRHSGLFNYFLYWQDSFNALETVQSSILKEVLQKKKIKNNNDKSFIIYLKLSIIALKNCDFNIERNMLEKALELKPSDLLANFKYAISNQYDDGDIEKSFEHLKRASEDPDLNCKELKDYMLSEIERIKKEGPRIRPKFSGLKYASY